MPDPAVPNPPTGLVPLRITITEVPFTPPPRGMFLLLTAPTSESAASFRALLHRLAEKGDPRVILVTSAGVREGKTLCAVNLALALAELQRYRVLLVEANPMSPTLAALFQNGAPDCLLDQLDKQQGQREMAFDVFAPGGLGLHVLAISPQHKGVPLSGPLFRRAIAGLKQSYDFIVVDGPAILAGPTANLIEDAMDGLLVVTKGNRSRARELKRALEQTSPANVLGHVMLDW